MKAILGQHAPQKYVVSQSIWDEKVAPMLIIGQTNVAPRTRQRLAQNTYGDGAHKCRRKEVR